MKTKAADYGHIKWIEDLVPNTMWSLVLVDYDKHALWGISHWGRKRQQFYGFAVNRESARDVYSKRRIIAVTKLEIVEWQNYKHLDWITVRRDDDKLYKFKEGDLKRLRIQDIEDMLLLLVQGKLTNLTVEERLAFNVSLRMFTRSIVIQRRVEDLQLAYSTPRGFIYQNKDKKNRLMRIDELHKFSDGTLDDVRTALNDRLKGIRMQYLPQTIWRQRDRDKAGAMIQAIDKQLKTRRIMRSLEKFVSGRPYEETGVIHNLSETLKLFSDTETVMDESGRYAQTSLSQSRYAPVMRTASAAAKPCQGDSSEFYLITGSIYTDQRETWFPRLGRSCIPERFTIHSNMALLTVKEFQRSFCLSDTERLSQSDKVLKLKNFKKDATLKLFKSTNQERYEHVFKESHSRQDEEQAQDLTSMITTSVHKIEVYELKTKDKA
ncbi:hypothetical protein Tco_0535445 [Tanacetum coccineum]